MNTKLILKSPLFILFIIQINTILSFSQVLVEAESFTNKGGWVLDQQFMEQMGSPYLMAHGLGVPVNNAKTQVIFHNRGVFKVWVRTYNWISPWYKAGDGPGAFQIKVNGTLLPNILGTKGDKWMWQEAGTIDLSKGVRSFRRYGAVADVELIDLSGFNGRVDALLFSKELDWIPPNDIDEIAKLRQKLLNLPEKPIETGYFDLVVVGGGVAGSSAALAASRLGLKVALVQDRPVLGGNNSSEVSVGLSGEINKNFYPKLGNMLRELSGIPIPENSHTEPGVMAPPKRGATKQVDELRTKIISDEPNISLFLNVHVNEVQLQGNTIIAVIGKDIESGIAYRFSGTLFSDCTGDGTLGYLAGADYREGRESYYNTYEPKAPLLADKHHLGTSNMWKSIRGSSESKFPILPWAAQLSDEYHLDRTSGGWTWESGFNKHTIYDGERIRDNLLRAIYGNWSYLKNNKKNYSNLKLNWVAYVAGKRESRRLLGDLILTENDIINNIDYPDKSFTTTWSIDLHFPEEENTKFFPGEEWQAYAIQTKLPTPYHVPYRTLYSRNLKNMFMAGRCISVTHVALGTVRVMATTAMMGEVVGIAAKVCIDKDAFPRDIYERYWDDMKKILEQGVPIKNWDVSKIKNEATAE